MQATRKPAARTLRDEMRAGDEETRREMHELHDDTLGRIDALREEMRAGDEETRRHARVLHEEVLARIAILDERWDGHPDARGRARQQRHRDRKR